MAFRIEMPQTARWSGLGCRRMNCWLCPRLARDHRCEVCRHCGMGTGLDGLDFPLRRPGGNMARSTGMVTRALASRQLRHLRLCPVTTALLPFAAFFASRGHGELPAIGWTFLTVALAQVAAITGWGDWFPWSVPALFSGAAGARGSPGST